MSTFRIVAIVCCIAGIMLPAASQAQYMVNMSLVTALSRSAPDGPSMVRDQLPDGPCPEQQSSAAHVGSGSSSSVR
jgi:hypothetical protein